MPWLFWILVFLLFYTYVGYGLLMVLWKAVMVQKVTAQPAQPPLPVTFIIPAYNEEAVIAQKIENTLALAYPPDLLHIIAITDGSTDSTPEIVKRYPQVRHLHVAERLGKSAAINKAVSVVTTPIIVFSDANAVLNTNCLQHLLAPYRNEKVGGVAGEKRIAKATGGGVPEGIYWQYESAIKAAEACFYTVMGAAGELFSIRTALFQPIPPAIVLDDFYLSATICRQGYTIAYASGAFSVEPPSTSLHDEQQRKVRISAGNFQAMAALPFLLNCFRHRRLSFQYLSHRVMRWVVGPLCLPLVLAVNLFLLSSGAPIFTITLLLQALFYGLAVVGWRLSGGATATGWWLLPYYFLFMNYGLYVGFIRYVTGRYSVLWVKADRVVV